MRRSEGSAGVGVRRSEDDEEERIRRVSENIGSMMMIMVMMLFSMRLKMEIRIMMKR